MPEASNAREAFLADFARSERSLPGAGRSWTAPIRRQAMAQFEAAGLPTTHLEEWRYTSVARLAGIPFVTAALEGPAPAAGDIAAASLAAGDAVELVFVDGRLEPGLSQIYGLPEGVKIGSLARALEDDSGWVKSDWLEPVFSRIAEPRDNVFVALNTALFRDGAFVWIPPGLAFARPIHLLHVSSATGSSRPVAAHPRHLVVVGDHAQARIIETFVSLGNSTALTNAVTEIAAGEGAVVEHLRLQDESLAGFHLGRVAGRLERSASLRSASIVLGGALSRVEIEIAQAGEGTSTVLDGLYLLDGEQHADNRTSVDHALPHGTSVQLYKGILAGSSHGVFNGRIIVRPGAQKTDSRQTNRNLLLTETALIDTKPELQIFADDVKCSHGATIGQLDEDAVFYLRSRGITEASARSLLTWAFASELLARLSFEPLRDRVHQRVLARLPGGAELREAS